MAVAPHHRDLACRARRPAVDVPTAANLRNAVLIAAGLVLLSLMALIVWRPLKRRTTW
jgi:hypothetical protein